MNYDLAFWRQKRAMQSPPVEIYRKLNSRENMEGRLVLTAVVDLPVEQILGRLKTAYPGFDVSGRLASFETPDGHCDLRWSRKHFNLTIEGDLGESLNPLVGILYDFGCPMFDPQENRRHDAEHGLAPGPVPKFHSPTPREKQQRKQRYEAVLSHAERRLSDETRWRERIKIVLATCAAIAIIALIWYVVRR